MNNKRIAELREVEKSFGTSITAKHMKEALDAVERLSSEVEALHSQLKVQDKVFASAEAGYKEEIEDLKSLLVYAEQNRQELAIEKNDLREALEEICDYTIDASINEIARKALHIDSISKVEALSLHKENKDD